MISIKGFQITQQADEKSDSLFFDDQVGPWGQSTSKNFQRSLDQYLKHQNKAKIKIKKVKMKQTYSPDLSQIQKREYFKQNHYSCSNQLTNRLSYLEQKMRHLNDESTLHRISSIEKVPQSLKKKSKFLPKLSINQYKQTNIRNSYHTIDDVLTKRKKMNKFIKEFKSLEKLMKSQDDRVNKKQQKNRSMEVKKIISSPYVCALHRGR